MIILIDTENHLINDSFMTTSQQIRSRKELLTPELKKIYKNLQLTPYLIVKDWMRKYGEKVF